MNYRITNHAFKRAKQRFRYKGSTCKFIKDNLNKSKQVSYRYLRANQIPISLHDDPDKYKFLYNNSGFLGVVRRKFVVTVIRVPEKNKD